LRGGLKRRSRFDGVFEGSSKVSCEVSFEWEVLRGGVKVRFEEEV
jgi:hypothetical protein